MWTRVHSFCLDQQGDPEFVLLSAVFVKVTVPLSHSSISPLTHSPFSLLDSTIFRSFSSFHPFIHPFPDPFSSPPSFPSLLPSPQDRKLFEKIGEPTEVALKVLAEKLNLYQSDLSSMSGKQLAACNFRAVQQEYTKLFTMEFSRDRKSMSVYCKPKDGDRPIMFVKVGIWSTKGSGDQ